MLLLNPTFFEISGEAKVLSVGPASDAVFMGARTPHHGNNEVARLDSRNFRSDFRNFTQGFPITKWREPSGGVPYSKEPISLSVRKHPPPTCEA